MGKKTIMITGASSGIGKETARALVEMGHTVLTVARRTEKMNSLKKMGCIPLKMDIAIEEDIQNVVNTALKNYGGVDILFNNAGYGLQGAMEDTSINDARYQFEVNLFGLARLTQLLLPSMRAKGEGKIINTSSVGGKIYSPLSSWYIATKHALEGWSDCLRIELAQFGIDVVIIEPGGVKSEFLDVATDLMLKRSGSGAYATMAKKVAKVQKKEGGKAADAKVISDLVIKAIKSKRPKTRYVAGQYSGIMLFMRKWFSDRMFDRIMLSVVK